MAKFKTGDNVICNRGTDMETTGTVVDRKGQWYEVDTGRGKTAMGRYPGFHSQSLELEEIKPGDRVRSATFEDTGKVKSQDGEFFRVDLDTFAIGGSSIVTVSAEDLTLI